MTKTSVLSLARAQHPEPRNHTVSRKPTPHLSLTSTLARAFHEAAKHAIACGGPGEVRHLIALIKQAISIAKHCEEELNLVLNLCHEHIQLVEQEDNGVMHYQRKVS